MDRAGRGMGTSSRMWAAVSKRGPGCGDSTHPVGWAHRQRLSHVPCVPHGLEVGRLQGPPASLHKTSSWTPACQGAVLSDHCCVLDTHTHMHMHKHPWSVVPPNLLPRHSQRCSSRAQHQYGLLFVHSASFILYMWYWGLNPGPHTARYVLLPLGCILSPRKNYYYYY